ncbi:NAD(P)-dependent oxidoreductase [Marinomonas sp. GJ51-6]|uniref:NAD(P)-dependent oxidoreductase n=1 Tax=Marinomonas sp. GJ51-6 TaxID=2992802 RepID=UPI0029350EC5|nr:NAD(P)-dependent oxidoreductase [Marinomonas sp. GJ51-6]WOD08086.1 NAD(P)-dependent oxidoreductase [Marinomonas sp. GJ51-6]
MMKVGFIGLGNVGGQLAGSLLRNGLDVMVRDLDDALMSKFKQLGAGTAASPKELAEACDVVITCLPSPAVCSHVMEADDGVIAGIKDGGVWLEMSTTDEAEIRRIAEKVKAKGAFPVDCPVSGGCHRAGTGNISIFAGCDRPTFDKVLPILTTMSRRIIHTGELGSASKLKVITNYLCSVHLVALSEALTSAKVMGLDMNVAYEAIKASSGNSFVHETESQVILNGSRDISFTLDLVSKDVGLFNDVANRHGLPLELAPLVVDIFKDGQARYGDREFSPNIIRRLEDACNVKVLGKGFPAQMVDDEPEEPGYEVKIPFRSDY